MDRGRTLCRLLSCATAIVGVWRLWEAFGMAMIAATAPLVGMLAVVGQGVAALVSAVPRARLCEVHDDRDIRTIRGRCDGRSRAGGWRHGQYGGPGCRRWDREHRASG